VKFGIVDSDDYAGGSTKHHRGDVRLLEMPYEGVSDGTPREPTDSVFSEVRKRISAAYKAFAGQRAYPGLTAAVDFSRRADGIMDDGGTMFVDCETASWPSTSVRCAAAIFPESDVDRTRRS